MFVVLIWPTPGFLEPEYVGPFPDSHWAQRYIDRRSRAGYHKLEIRRLHSPVIIKVPTGISFDPEKGIDEP